MLRENRLLGPGVCLLLFVVTLGLSPAATAQTDSESEKTTIVVIEELDLDSVQTFFEVNYGLGTPAFDGLGEDFNTVGLLELKLGMAIRDSVAPGIIDFADFYVFGTSFSEGLNSSDGGDGTDVRSELSRFGGGNRMGYGFGEVTGAFSLYNQNSLNWTKLESKAYDESPADAQAVFDRYGDSYHFGQLYEAGFKFDMSQKVALNFGAEGAVIFPRHVFWPWLGSVAIYSGVQSGLSVFVARVTEPDSKMRPILDFLLKNGASLGYFLLQKQDMNWPFTSETPVTVSSAKLGLSVGF